MKVSIIIIAYNEEHYISSCIASLLSQTHQEFELVMVDDGSTDTTWSTMQSFHDKRIILVQHKRRKGYASARNTGLANARGDLIFFTDADCVAHKDWISEGIAYMEQHPHLVAASNRATDEVTKLTGTPRMRNEYRRSLLQSIISYPNTINAVYRTSALKEIGGFDTRYDLGGEDIDLGIRIQDIGAFGRCRKMKVIHAAKKMNLARGMWLLKRRSIHVNIIKDHSARYPQMRKSLLCYHRILSPHYLAAMIFPPFILFLYHNRGLSIRSASDALFLIPFYIGLWYSRFWIWRQAIKERIFLI